MRPAIHFPALTLCPLVALGCAHPTVEMRLGREGQRIPLERAEREDAYFAQMKEREAARDHVERKLPAVAKSRHLWVAALPGDPPVGSQTIHLRTTDMFGQTFEDYRIIAIRP
ncbi:MAG TPA: calcineurin-like phosphoesterase C-terminal domain-containing protein [Alphaproteobacteria bacterium]|nr:calcineurin-like phosphoesterase C-terminal domain-containing protein [Alphaproteobacteria bacterium]